MKPVVQSAAAASDIRQAVEYYRNQATTEIAMAFIDAVEQAVERISTWPASGSTRFAEILDLPDLQSVALSRFPYIVFYVDQPDHVDVWRILHGLRDIPPLLHENLP